jgi:multidrug transporter EmrE-like cation transporter
MTAWLQVFMAVGIASAGNSISAIWASGEKSFSVWLLLLVLVAPLVFVTFGLVAARTGLAVAAGVIDALLTVTTMIIGLTFFREWEKVSFLQYTGMAFTLAGICLLLLFPKTST